MRVLFVCLGNICRSPTAAGIMRHLLDEAGLDWEVDSAGTGAWHVGNPPDPRSAAAAAQRGIRLEGAARQVTREDFDRYDLVLAADRSNLRELLALAPRKHRHKVRLLLGDRDVPDPYYGAENGFDEVLDLCEDACRKLLAAHA